MERGALTAEILRRYTAGETCHEVASALGVAPSTVWTVARGAGASRSRRDAQLQKRLQRIIRERNIPRRPARNPVRGAAQ